MKLELEQSIARVVQGLFGVDVHIELTRPDEQFGDFATNVALQLAKQLGKNPREVAESLRQKLEVKDHLQSVEVAGPGFLNLTVPDAALAAALQTVPAQSLSGKKILVE